MNAFFIFSVYKESDHEKTPMFSLSVQADTWINARMIVTENLLPGFWFTFHGSTSLKDA